MLMADCDGLYLSLSQKIDHFLVVYVAASTIMIAGCVAESVNEDDIFYTGLFVKLAASCVFLLLVAIHVALRKVPMTAGVV